MGIRGRWRCRAGGGALDAARSLSVVVPEIALAIVRDRRAPEGSVAPRSRLCALLGRDDESRGARGYPRASAMPRGRGPGARRPAACPLPLHRHLGNRNAILRDRRATARLVAPRSRLCAPLGRDDENREARGYPRASAMPRGRGPGARRPAACPLPHHRHPGNRVSDTPGSESPRGVCGSPIPALRFAPAGMTRGEGREGIRARRQCLAGGAPRALTERSAPCP